MTHVRRAVACIAALTAALFATALPLSTAADAVPPDVDHQRQRRGVVARRPSSSPTAASSWRQFPGFETRDAALAIAEGAQTGSTWNTTEARERGRGRAVRGDGPTPFNALDDLRGHGRPPRAPRRRPSC